MDDGMVGRRQTAEIGASAMAAAVRRGR